MSQAGTVSSGSGPTPPTGRVVTWEVSNEIDFTVGGLKTIFSTGATTRFWPISFVIFVDSISGLISQATLINLGFTAPTYFDYFNNFAFPDDFTTPAGSGVAYPLGEGLITEAMPINTTLYIDIGTPAVATTALGRIFVTGFYF